MNKKDFNKYIRSFDFIHLFNELGWDYLNEKLSRKIDDESFEFHSIGHKEGFRVIICKSETIGKIPGYMQRRKIQNEISKFYHENLLIFIDKNLAEQTWQMIDRQPNKPNQFRQTNWKKHQDPELLYQRLKGVFFSLEEQDKLTIVDVTRRFCEHFTANAEKVTKLFYDKFKQEHTGFLSFIDGISEKVDKEWYASLMLNRLMFCYFIQKKGFLNNDLNYLRNKLKETREKKGRDKFYSFYKNFLIILFHKGLGSPDRSKDLSAELGNVPYLNGGLFDVHELEKNYPDIEIGDKAFELIFNFFDQYEWHLDNSPTSTGRDINPDVIGYIFEKYINDRSQMGAYYTKEDITDYISKNCIIPYLFDEVKRNYPSGLKPEAETWELLKESGNKYIYDAVKHGVPETGGLSDDLPDMVKAGFNEELAKKIVEDKTGPHLFELRKEWNKPAPAEIALPTEIYREVIERRKRYEEVKTKVENGEITEINDFITYNLNIKQFVQDILESTGDPAFIKQFYEALSKVTVLDPTCGSGAFLFAAMNILETLYKACITRMESFVAEAGKGKYPAFEKVLDQVNRPEHPNLDYFIYKSIILNNLYGVDIMNEAVEIAKLRLFLKLMATVDPDYAKPNLGMEPLPDIDFNIRCGNTLVGFATGEELKKGLEWTFDGVIAKPIIEEKCEVVAMAFKRYKEIQLYYGDDYEEFKKAKEELNRRLKELNKELNELLHKQYSGIIYDNWIKAYQPFHWFAEFYEIVEEQKGFNVIIGNPPYVEYSPDKFSYNINAQKFRTFPSRNLYSYCFERSKQLLSNEARIGLIVQISSVSTPTMETMVKEIKSNTIINWISNYATRPSYLFDGVTMNLSIILSKYTNVKSNDNLLIYTSKYLRWVPESRKYLFENLPYCFVNLSKLMFSFSIPKLTFSQIENRILDKVLSQDKRISHYLNEKYHESNQELFYRTAGGRYFKIFIDRDFGSESKSNKSKLLKEQIDVHSIISILSSNLWWWYYTLHFDMYNCKDYMIYNFPFDYNTCSMKSNLKKKGEELCNDLILNAEEKYQFYESTGERKQLIFRPSVSKGIMDNIDIQISRHYGLIEEELDFIINYDIKYRMGIGSGDMDD